MNHFPAALAKFLTEKNIYLPAKATNFVPNLFLIFFCFSRKKLPLDISLYFLAKLNFVIKIVIISLSYFLHTYEKKKKKNGN